MGHFSHTYVVCRIGVNGAWEASLFVVIQYFLCSPVVHDLAVLHYHQIIKEIEDLGGRLMDGAHNCALLRAG